MVNKGRKKSKETRRKMSEAKIGENNPQYGIPLSKETKRKISEANKGRRNQESKKKTSEA